MKIQAVHGARDALQDEVLALIRRQAQAAAPQAPRQPPAQPATEAVQPVGEAQLDRAVEQVNRVLQQVSATLRFEVDADSGRTIVKVVDDATGELIRQIPSEAAVQVAHSIDRMVGHLLRHSA